ncbi:MAG: DUF6273 domain-containing protein [Lachnospiraceae bacterium]|jgi:hypothetical protein|nr:DUF6273 domain-containing protein [Lachnospiraceae bacterium]
MPRSIDDINNDIKSEEWFLKQAIKFSNEHPDFFISGEIRRHRRVIGELKEELNDPGKRDRERDREEAAYQRRIKKEEAALTRFRKERLDIAVPIVREYQERKANYEARRNEEKQVIAQSERWRKQGLCTSCGGKKFLTRCKDCKKMLASRYSKKLSSEVYLEFIIPDDAKKIQDIRVGEWCLLDIQSDRALLISNKVIKEVKFNDKVLSSEPWINCSLRKYLNSTFYMNLESNIWKKVIEVRLENNAAISHRTGLVSQTTDKIFLLSIEEVLKYFGDSGAFGALSDTDFGTVNDQFNKDRSAYPDNWWLRSSSQRCSNAAIVDEVGEISCLGKRIFDSNGLRPAMWVKL